MLSSRNYQSYEKSCKVLAIKEWLKVMSPESHTFRNDPISFFFYLKQKQNFVISWAIKVRFDKKKTVNPALKKAFKSWNLLSGDKIIATAFQREYIGTLGEKTFANLVFSSRRNKKGYFRLRKRIKKGFLSNSPQLVSHRPFQNNGFYFSLSLAKEIDPMRTINHFSFVSLLP